TLTVGMQFDFDNKNGFVELSSAGTPIGGFDVDVACRIGKLLGQRIALKNVKFANLIPELQAGNIDLIIGQMNRDRTRLALIEQIPYTFEGKDSVAGQGNTPPAHNF